MPRKQFYGGIIGGSPVLNNAPRTSGVFNLGSLSSDNAFEAPSLDLNFDGQLSSFTRATTNPTAAKANGDQLATEIVTQNKTDTVQSKYMGPNGKLISGHVENLLTYSSVASWTQGSNMQVTASSVTDPFGGTGAFRIDDQDGAAWRSMDIAATVAAQTWSTLSIYIHASDNTSTKLGFNINYNGGGGQTGGTTLPRLTIVNGVPSTPSNDTGGQEAYHGIVTQVAGTDWYRWEISFPFGVNSISFYPAVAAASSTGYVTVFGAQLELGGAASQLVQTSGATASAQVARVEYDASGNPLGLLVEEARTNLMTSTDNVGGTGAGYFITSSGFTVTDDYGTAPDGTTNANRFVYTGSTYKQVSLSISGVNITAGDVYTASVYYKATSSTTANSFRLNVQEAGTGGASTTTANLAATSEWQRASATITCNNTNASGTLNFRINQPTGSDTTDILVWGAQLEKGDGATSHIPNTATTGTKTRTADDITLSTSNFGYNTAAMTTVIDATISSASHDYARFFEINNNNGSSPRHAVFLAPSNQVQFQWRDDVNGSAVSAYVSNATLPFSAKLGQRTDGTTGSYAADGVVTTYGTVPQMTSPVTKVILGSQGVTAHMNGHIRRFTYWPRAISDASLATYTGANPPTQELIRPTRKWGGMLGRSLTTDVVKAPVVGHSLRFDGTTDYLLTDAVSASNRQTFTTSAWIKLSDDPSADVAILGSSYVGGAYNYQVGLTVTANNDLFWFEFNSTWVAQYQTQNTLNVGRWYHVVCQVDTTAATKCKIWIDGTLQTLQTVAYDYSTGSNTLMSVGTWPGTSTAQKFNVGGIYSEGDSILRYKFPGQLAEVHFVDGQALDASYFGETRNNQWVPKEVTGVTYGTNGFYLPFDRRTEGVTLLLDGSSTTDATGTTTTTTSSGVTAKTASNAGATVDAYGDPNGYVLDGYNTGLYLTGSGSTFSFTDDFTLEAWVYLDTIGTNNTLFRMGDTALLGHKGLSAPSSTTTGTWVLYLPNAADTGFGTQNQTLFTGLTTGAWKHIAVTKSGNTYRGYVNGVQTSGNIVDTTAGALASDVFRLGLTGSYGWDGKMQDVRFTKGIVRDIAADWTAGVYSSPLTNDIIFGSLGRDASTNGNDFTVPANTLTPDDQLIDSPNLRFATLDPAAANSGVLFSEANFNLQAPNTSTWYNALATQTVGPNDKVYFEWSNNGTTHVGYMGLTASLPSSGASSHLGQTSTSWGLWIPNANQVNAVHNGSQTLIVGSGDDAPLILMCAIDRPNGEIHFGYNGLWRNNNGGYVTSSTPNIPVYTNIPTTGTYYVGGSVSTYGSVIYNLFANFGQDHTFAGAKSPLVSPFTDSDGNGEFYYQPPTGFRALTTKIVGSDAVPQSTGVISLAEHYQSKLPQ